MLTVEYIREQVQRKAEELMQSGDLEDMEPFSENLMRMIMSAGHPGYSHERYIRAIEEGILAARGDDSGKQKALILSLRGSRKALHTFAPPFERGLERGRSAAASAVKNSLLFGKTGICSGKSWGRHS